MLKALSFHAWLTVVYWASRLGSSNSNQNRLIRAGAVDERLHLETHDSLSPDRYQFVFELIWPFYHVAELRGDRHFGMCEACEHQKEFSAPDYHLANISGLAALRNRLQPITPRTSAADSPR
jgi:hypothetical protein